MYYNYNDENENNVNPEQENDIELTAEEFENIPDWDNSESCYIPMFDDADVLLR